MAIAWPLARFGEKWMAVDMSGYLLMGILPDVPRGERVVRLFSPCQGSDVAVIHTLIVSPFDTFLLRTSCIM